MSTANARRSHRLLAIIPIALGVAIIVTGLVFSGPIVMIENGTDRAIVVKADGLLGTTSTIVSAHSATTVRLWKKPFLAPEEMISGGWEVWASITNAPNERPDLEMTVPWGNGVIRKAVSFTCGTIAMWVGDYKPEPPSTVEPSCGEGIAE